MAVAIRLMRFGKKDRPFYRIVAIDKKRKRESKYLAKIGDYDPLTEPASIKVDKEKLEYYLSRGAQLSEGVRKLWKRIKKQYKINYQI